MIKHLSRPKQGIRSLALATLFVLSPASVFAAPSWGDPTPRAAETPPQDLKPGQFKWQGGAIPSGPIVVVVSLAEQRAYVYRNGVRIGVSSVSTGKPGYGTPTGVFTVLEKDADHRSKTYNNQQFPVNANLLKSKVSFLLILLRKNSESF